MNYSKGIDVSEHNGFIDWEKVKKSGEVSFAMLRAGYGVSGNVDKRFHRNASECNRLGIPIGIYYFSYATSSEDALIEAEKCLSIISDYKIDYPVAYDFEDDSVRVCRNVSINIVGKDFPTSLALNFLNRIFQNGYKPMLYTNPAYIDRYFDLNKLKKYPVWLACWPVCDPDLSVGPPRKCDIWQYSSTGSVPGIKSAVDLNACYVSYLKDEVGELKNMNKEDLKKLMIEAFDLQKQSNWAMPEIEKAKNLGVTDGSRPFEFASRAEVMAMIVRAIELIK